MMHEDHEVTKTMTCEAGESYFPRSSHRGSGRPGLSGEYLLQPMVAVGSCVLGGGITEAILCPEFFRDLVIDLGDVLIFLDLEEPATGLLCHTFEDLLSIDVALAGIVSSTIASTWIPPATAAG